MKKILLKLVNKLPYFEQKYIKVGTPSYIQKNYDYGCVPGQYKMVVYRITYTKPDGSVIEFSWQQIKDYCKKYELETVKELYFGQLNNWGTSNAEMPEFMEKFFESMQRQFNMEKIDQYCSNKVFSEGLVIRRDGLQTYSSYKLKSKAFLKHESESLDSEDMGVE